MDQNTEKKRRKGWGINILEGRKGGRGLVSDPDSAATSDKLLLH